MSVSFDELKLAAYDNALTTKKIAVADLEIITNSMVAIKGMPIKITKEAYKTLLESIGINHKLLENLDKVAPEMVQGYMKNVQKKKKIGYIYAVLNRHRSIVKFTRFQSTVMPPEVYLSLMERLMNDNPTMSIEDIALKNNTLTLGIEDKLSERDLFGLAGGEKGKEVFRFGTTIQSGVDSPLAFLQNIKRMWCSNGCVNTIKSHTMSMARVTTHGIGQFLEKFDNFQSNDYKSDFFIDNMKRATSTQASVREVLQAHKSIEQYLGEGAGYKALPIGDIYQDYARVGVDIEKLNFRQTQTCPTEYKVWDVFNVLTDVASNSKVEPNVDMQIDAGKLLSSSNDIENIVGVNPYARKLIKRG